MLMYWKGLIEKLYCCGNDTDREIIWGKLELTLDGEEVGWLDNNTNLIATLDRIDHHRARQLIGH